MSWEIATVAVSVVLVAATAAGWWVGRGSGRSPAAGGLSLAARLDGMQAELGRVRELVVGVERHRDHQLGELSGQLRAAGEQTAALAESTRQLREALASSRARGQWGERMADDVLRLAGFAEGVNYRRQRALAGGGIPDYTFLLPRGMELHMDVKFPLDNYLRHLQASSELEVRRYQEDFLRDVRDRVKELAGRDYLHAPGSVGCVLLFIPNEQLYAFIQERGPTITDEALRGQVVLCSPLTLFAVLAVVRHAVDTFVLERASAEILDALGDFARQWDQFRTQMDRLGGRLDAAQKEFDALTGVRQRQLDRQVERIDRIRAQRDRDDEGDDPGRAAPLVGSAP